MKEWILENISYIVSTIFGGGSLIGWFVERKKRKLEEKVQSADALKSMQEAYDVFTKDYVNRYTELIREIESLKEERTKLTQLLKEEAMKNCKNTK